MARLRGWFTWSVFQVFWALPAAIAAPPSPPQVVNVDGAIQNCVAFCVPPDTHGAVGSTQFVQISHAGVYVFSKEPAAGTTSPPLLKSSSLAAFFGYVAQPLFDPRVVYDATAKRWVVTAEAMPESNTVQRHFIAASTSSDATGSFYVFNVNVNLSGNNNFWDFPQLGITSTAVLITANVYLSPSSNTFLNSALLAINKSLLYKGKLSYIRFDALVDPSVAPPVVVDASTTAFLVSARTSSASLKLYRLTPSGSTFALTGPAAVPVPSYEVPAPAPQPGTTAMLDTGDNRFSNASSQVGNDLWQTHTIAEWNGRATNRYYRISTSSNTVTQMGDFGRSTSSSDFNPSIAANLSGTTFVTWTSTDVSTHAQIRFARKAYTATDFSSGLVIFTSTIAYNPSGGINAVERWGDYSATTVDPSDSSKAWGTAEKIDSTAAWGSRIFSHAPLLNLADMGNRRVQMFKTDGSFVYTFGSYQTEPGQFITPSMVAVDATQVYVTDLNSNRVQIFARDGTFISRFGSFGSGAGEFNYPWGIAADDQRLYVVDRQNNRVQAFSKSGGYLFEFGGFTLPTGIAIDNFFVYVIDTGFWSGGGYPRIQIFDKGGTRVGEISLVGLPAGGIYNGVSALAVDDTRIYVSDGFDVVVLTKGGSFVSRFGSFGGGTWGIASDNSQVYVVDLDNDRVLVFNTDGSFVSEFGSAGSRNGQLQSPAGIAVF